MASTAPITAPGLIFTWSRVRFTLAVSAGFGLLHGLGSGVPVFIGMLRAALVGLAVLLAFGLFERWPRHLPRWMARPVLQLIGIVLSVPIASGFAYLLTQFGTAAETHDPHNISGLIFLGLVFAPWIAVGAMLRQRGAHARELELALDLERSEFERQALDARLRLLQAQVEPHFLFNTLANVQALVDSGSPKASAVLTNLVAYLRAAVPGMQAQAVTLAREVELVRAYLELMQMRIPDRLQYSLRVDPAALELRCPPMMLHTLVENAVRHGIDPCESGGRIDVEVRVDKGRCLVRVSDTGVGLGSHSRGLGTGLKTLRERLNLTFGSGAELYLSAVTPRGTCAEISFAVTDTAR